MRLGACMILTTTYCMYGVRKRNGAPGDESDNLCLACAACHEGPKRQTEAAALSRLGVCWNGHTRIHLVQGRPGHHGRHAFVGRPIAVVSLHLSRHAGKYVQRLSNHGERGNGGALLDDGIATPGWYPPVPATSSTPPQGRGHTDRKQTIHIVCRGFIAGRSLNCIRCCCSRTALASFSTARLGDVVTNHGRCRTRSTLRLIKNMAMRI